MANVKGGRYVKSLRFPIKSPLTGEEFYPSSNGNWRFNKDKIELLMKNNEIYFGKDGKGRPKLKRFLADVREGVPLASIWDEVGFNTTATGELMRLFGTVNIFDTPKPLPLITEILKLTTIPAGRELILDFFAGSGTTGEAVVELNDADKGKRKFILCTDNQNNICTEVCYQRLRKVISGYQNPNNESIQGIQGNLMYFKTDFVDAEPTDLNKKRLVDKSTDMLCLKEDCFNEVKNEEHFKIFANEEGKSLGIIYDDKGIEPFKQEVRNSKRKFTVYVFSLDESAREEEFEDIQDFVSLKPIPAVILNVYKRIFK
jgi:adenine-specific DNA-methyltransferase